MLALLHILATGGDPERSPFRAPRSGALELPERVGAVVQADPEIGERSNNGVGAHTAVVEAESVVAGKMQQDLPVGWVTK